MQDNIGMDIDQSQIDRSKLSSFDFAVFVPRLWIVMTAFFIPFIILSFNYFEALEGTGAIGAFIADTLMPASVIAYVGVIVVLKRRKI